MVVDSTPIHALQFDVKCNLPFSCVGVSACDLCPDRFILDSVFMECVHLLTWKCGIYFWTPKSLLEERVEFVYCQFICRSEDRYSGNLRHWTRNDKNGPSFSTTRDWNFSWGERGVSCDGWFHPDDNVIVSMKWGFPHSVTSNFYNLMISFYEIKNYIL
jgi:hypothetical protein